jgi:hypothetical protein
MSPENLGDYSTNPHHSGKETTCQSWPCRIRKMRLWLYEMSEITCSIEATNDPQSKMVFALQQPWSSPSFVFAGISSQIWLIRKNINKKQ